MKSRYFARLATACATIIAALAVMAPLANAATPAPGYEEFEGCPSKAENSTVSSCIRTDITGGHFQMGNKDVPISKPMALVGGVKPDLTGFVYNSKGGLQPVKQVVPGGVIGLTGLDWLVNFLNLEGLKLYAITELAGTPQLANIAEPTLPIKVHLINPVLGNNCYVGSNSNPINLNLTFFTTSPPPPNEPISGTLPSSGIDPLGVVRFTDGVYVDNAFASPGANGCTLTLFGFIPISINGIVNSASGLPSPAGTNETVQNVDISVAGVKSVYP